MSAVSRAIRAAAAKVSALPGGGSATLTASLVNPMLTATGGDFEIYHVTNLDNTDTPGSFSEGLRGGSSAVTRIVVFDISGTVDMPFRGDAGWLHEDILMNRNNLYVAGETAPPSSNGRGFVLNGGIRVYGADNVVFSHISLVPSDGTMTSDPESGSQLWAFNLVPTRNIVLRNCSLRHTNDMSFTFNMRTASSPSYLENVVALNCMMAQPLNTHIGTANDAVSGHGYICNFNSRQYRGLYYGNVLACGNWRTPWFNTGCSGVFANNYVFNITGPSTGPLAGGWSHPAYPHCRGATYDGGARNHDNWYYGAADTGGRYTNENHIIGDYVGNHIEGGDRYYLPDNVFHPIYCEDVDLTANGGPADGEVVFHLDDNRCSTWFDQVFANVSGNATCTYKGSEQENYLLPTSQTSNVFIWRDSPRHTLPFTLMPSASVRDYALAYAGAWPSDRSPGDTRVITGITDRTLSAVRATPGDADMALATDAADVPAVGTANTGTLGGGHSLVTGYDSGSITQLEQWLHDQHMAALGIPTGAADYDPNIAGNWIASTEEAAA